MSGFSITSRKGFVKINKDMKVTDIISENNIMHPEEDHRNQIDINDKRKPTLTLRHLNKLRKMRELKKADMIDRRSGWETMYGSSDEAEMPPAF